MALELETDKIQLAVVVDGTPARKELAELKQASRLLGNEQERLNKLIEQETNLRKLHQGKKTSDDYKRAAQAIVELNKELEANKAATTTNADRQKVLRDSIGNTGLSLNELRAKAIGLRKTLAAGLLDNDAMIANARALADVEKQIQRVGTAAGRNALIWEQDRKNIDLNRMSVEQLTTGLKSLKQIQDTSDPQSEEYKAATADVKLLTDQLELLTNEERQASEAWKAMRGSMKLEDMSVEQLRREAQVLKELRDALPPTSAEFQKLDAELVATENRLKSLTTESGRTLREWEQLRKGMRLDDMSIDQLKLEQQYLKNLQSTLRQTDPALNEVERELLEVNKALETTTSSTALFDKQWERTRASLKLTDLSLEQLEAETRRLKRELHTLNPKDVRFEPLRKQLQDTERQMKVVTTGLGPFGQAWASMKTNVMSAGAVLGTVFAGGAIVQGLRNLVTGAAKVSDEIVRIQKVTGKTTEEVRGLNRSFGQINTRTATSELRGIAIGLGQAGQEVSAAAVTAIDKINLALGDEFGSNAQEITNTISVLRNNLSDLKSGDYAKDVGQIGNAILVLGQSGIATAPVVSDIATRVAGVARQFKVSSGDILGTAAAFQELGINTERGSTAYTKLLQKISVEPKAFADVVKQAGGDVDEFLRLVNTDMQAAFLMVAKAARTAGGENTAFGAILKELETSGAGVSELLSKAGANTELFAEKSKLATEALTNQNAINAQSAQVNSTLAAELEKLGKVFVRVFSSSTVQNGLKSLISAATSLLGWVQRNAAAFTFWGTVLLKGVTAWAAFRAGTVAATIAQRAWNAATVAGATLTSIFTGKVNLATRASQLFAAAWKTNPVGLIASALTAAYGVFSTFSEVVDTARDSLHELAQADQDAYQKANTLYYQILLANEGTAERRDLINELKALYPNYLSALDADKSSNEDLTLAMQGLNEQLVRKIELQKLDAKAHEQAEATADIAIERAETETNLKKRLVEIAKEYGLTLKNNGTLEQKALDLREQLIAQQDDETDIAYQKSLGSIRLSLEKLQTLSKGLNAANKEGAQLDVDRSEILRNLNDDFLSAADSAQKLYGAQRNSKPFPFEPFAVPGRPAPLTGAPGATNATNAALKEQKLTVEELSAKIKELQDQQNSANNAATYAELQRQIDHYEALKKAITGTSSSAGKSSEDLKKHLKDLEDITREAHDRLALDTRSADEREILELDNKHRDERDKYVEHQKALVTAGRLSQQQASNQLSELERTHANERANLIEKQGNERAEKAKEADEKYLASRRTTEQKITDEVNREHLAQLQAELDYWDQRIAEAKERGEDYTQLENERFKAQERLLDASTFSEIEARMQEFNGLINLAKQYNIDSTQLEQARARALKLIQDRQKAQEKKDQRDHNRVMRGLVLERLRDFSTIAGGLNDLVGGIQQYRQAEVQAAEAAADADGERTQEEIARIEQRKRAQRDAALVAIAVQGAIAIANGVASAMTLQPWPLAVASALSTVGIVIGLMAQAKALMNDAGSSNRQQNNQNVQLNNVPLGRDGLAARDRTVMKKGGAHGTALVNLGPLDQSTGGGVLRGQPHGQGGNLLIDSRTGEVLAEVERDELMLIMSREATKANEDLIPLMLQASKNGERLPIGPMGAVATAGGTVRVATDPIAQPRPETVHRAMRLVHFADGGAHGPRGTYTFANGVGLETAEGGGSNEAVLAMLGVLVKEVRDGNKAAKEFPKTLQAVVSLKDFHRKDEESDRLRDSNRLRPTG